MSNLTPADFYNGLPPKFIEDYRIVDPADPKARAYAQDMMRIASRLLKTSNPDFQFLVSASDDPNAFVISKAQPPIVTFTKGLINSFESEDELAGVMAHEITHDLLYKRLGGDKTGNSKPEEMGADIWAVKLLQDAGYSPKGLETVIAKLPSNRDELTRADSYIDPHPGHDLRQRLMANTRAYLRSMTGKENTAEESLKKPVLDALDAPYESYIAKLARESDFESRNTLGKLQLIGEWVDKEQFSISKSRIADLSALCKQTLVDHNDADQVAVFDKIINRILISKEETGKRAYQGPVASDLYLAVQQSWMPGSESPIPLGHLKTLEDKSKAFIGAETKEAATRAAMGVLDVSRRMDPKVITEDNFYVYGDNMYKRIFSPYNWSQKFPMPSRNELVALKKQLKEASTDEERERILADNQIKFPWIKHIRFALENETLDDQGRRSGSDVIKTVLGMHGVQDDWLPGELRDAKYAQVLAATSNDPQHSALVLMDYDGLLKHNIGIHDSAKRWEPLSTKQWPTISKMKPDYEMHHVTTDEHNRIVWLHTAERNYKEGMPKQEYITSERERLDERDYEEKKLIASADWSLLEAADSGKFKEFVNKYRIALTPDISLVEGGDSFARAFIQKMTDVVRDHPNMESDLKAFLLASWGRDSVTGLLSEYVDLTKKQHPEIYSSQLTVGLTEDEQVKRFDQYLRLDHPYVQYILNNPNRILKTEDRLAFLGEHLQYLGTKDNAVPVLERWNIPPSQLLERPLSATPAAFIDHCDNSIGLFSRAPAIILDLGQTETLEMLKENGDKLLSLDELQALRQLNKYSVSSDFFSEAYEEIEKRAVTYAKQKLKEPTSLEERTYVYQVMQTGQLLVNDPDIRNNYEQTIITEIEKLGPGNKALEAAQHMLFDQELSNPLTPNFPKVKYSASIADPDLRKRLIDVMVQSYKVELGLEPSEHNAGSADYITKAKHVIDTIVNKTSGGNRYQILAALADAVESQRELSYYMRARATDASMIEMAKKGHLFSGGELMLDRINKHDELRFATLDYLRNPATADAVTHYRLMLEKYYKDGALLHPDEKGSVQAASTLGGSKIKLTENAREGMLRDMHRNFNAMPLEAKTVYTDQVLFPPDRTNDEIFKQSQQWVFDKVLPVQKSAIRLGKAKPTQQESIREAIEFYLASSDEADRRLTLSAMVVASDPTQQVGSNLGRSLKMVLYAHGPAGIKTAQAIHSHRQTPEHIKEEMAEAKIMANKPPRWDVFSIYDKTVPQSERDQCRRVGEVLGVGSYGITVENEMTDGSFAAYTLLKGHAESRAKREFGRMRHLAGHIVEKHPEIGPLKDMIGYAEKMSGPETNMDTASLQNKRASENYNGLTVNVDGMTCHFSSAPWLSHGQNKEEETGYKSTLVMEGKHFQDLPESKPEDKELKRKIAKAIILSEMMMLSSGRTFDHDRHGGQQRIVVEGDQIYIGNFDFGAMSLEPPTKEQKEAFAHILVDTFASHMFSKAKNQLAHIVDASEAVAGRGVTTEQTWAQRAASSNDMAKQFSKRVAKYKNKPDVMDHIASIERGLLATDSIMNYLTPQDKMEVLATALSHKGVDADFKRALGDKMPLIYPLVEKKIASMQTPNLSFEYRPETQMRTKQPCALAQNDGIDQATVPNAAEHNGIDTSRPLRGFASRLRRIPVASGSNQEDTTIFSHHVARKSIKPMHFEKGNDIDQSLSLP